MILYDLLYILNNSKTEKLFQNRVDMLEQSSIADVDYQWDMLYPGDCIFIPAQYSHQVTFIL